MIYMTHFPIVFKEQGITIMDDKILSNVNLDRNNE